MAHLPSSVRVIVRGWLNCNQVLLFDPSGHVLVDSGYHAHAEETLRRLASPEGFGEASIARLVNTHCHSDHIGGNPAVVERYRCRVTIPRGEAPEIDDWARQERWNAYVDQEARRFRYDDTIAEGEAFNGGGLDWEAFAAPGHDMQALMFFEPRHRLLMTGDALWSNGLGFVWPHEGLDAAVAQGANAIGIVVYDLPNRDCSALASNGELLIAQNGLNRYKTEYIDVIFNKINQAKYSGLRIVMIIEPDSLPNLITNINSFQKCQEAGSPSPSTGAYAQGVQYAIGTLRSIPNTYAYIDAAHAAWLGWPNNFNPFVTLMKQIGAGIPGGIGKVDGFITNTANTNVWVEPFMTANQMISGQPVRSLQGWYDFNDFIDEQPYATALRNALASGSDGFSTSIGMLVDTSRNGWGGPNRPTGPSTSTDLRTFVLATTIDKRIHKGNWCNQNGAGIGARPAANPAAGFDAFVWVKPPGESDGSSSLIPVGPDNPDGKGFDPMCDPNYHGNSLNGNNFSGALPNAPVSGRFFQAQFQQLVQNAFPAFQ